MKQFKRIEIQKDNASLMKLVEKMKALDNEDFYYDQEASDRTNEGCKKGSVCATTYYALFSTKQDSLYLTTVYVSVKDNELKVFNVTSSDPRYSELGVERYNFVITQFFHNFMVRCMDASLSDRIVMLGEEPDLKDLIGGDAYNALIQWEQSCNKDNPIAHPMDEKKWFKFLKKLHDSGKIFHPEDFSQWLTEDRKWSSYHNGVIIELADKLEYSLSLLNYYDDTSNTEGNKEI